LRLWGRLRWLGPWALPGATGATKTTLPPPSCRFLCCCVAEPAAAVGRASTSTESCPRLGLRRMGLAAKGFFKK
jgi:hypothetical protein